MKLCKYVTNTVFVDEYREAVKRYKGAALLGREGGLYFLYDKNMELLYIGWTNSGFYSRIPNHVNGASNAVHFYKDIHYIRMISEKNTELIREDCKGILDIEHYMIKKLNPKHNKQRGSMATLPNGVESTEEYWRLNRY